MSTASSLLAAGTGQITLSPLQTDVARLPERWQGRPVNVVLGGGRGSSKTTTALLCRVGPHIEAYAARARVLILRRTHQGLLDLVALSRELFAPMGATYNGNTGVWTFPSGAFVELNQVSDPGHFRKYQGKTFSMLVVDEAQQWPSPDLLDILRSCLRGGGDVARSMILTANPGDAGHGWLVRRFMNPTVRPWHPFEEVETGAIWVRVDSTFRDNPFIDQREYERELCAATAGDPELQRAWLENDWSINRGSFFGDVLDQRRVAFGPWPRPGCGDELADHWFAFQRDRRVAAWRFYVALDWGSAAPTVAFVVGWSSGIEALDGRYYARDSLLLLDEWTSALPNRPNEGERFTTVEVASRVIDMCKSWQIAPHGVADDAIFANVGSASGSIADELSAAGLYLLPAGKGDRIGGWQKMRRFLHDAGRPDVPGLFVSRACRYFWQTVPTLVRDPRRPEDLLTYGVADHAADACRYAVVGSAVAHGSGSMPI